MQATAQVRFGPKIGMNFSKMTLKASGISIDPKILVGFNVGMIAEFPVGNNFVIQPGLLFSSKGSKYSLQGESAKIAPSFIELPINGVYKLDMSSAQLMFFAGPYFGYGIGGSVKSGSESYDISWGTGSDNDLKPFDFGLNIGAGVEISNFLISAQYGIGMANLVTDGSSDTEMKNKVLGISMAYIIGGK